MVTNTDGGSQNSVYSPIWTPCALELAYCARLASWWKAVQEERKLVQGQQVQIGGGDAQAPMSMSHHGARQHRLIRDADPRAPPDGYFDCTVEVRSTESSHKPLLTPLSDSLLSLERQWPTQCLCDRLHRKGGDVPERGKLVSRKSFQSSSKDRDVVSSSHARSEYATGPILVHR